MVTEYLPIPDFPQYRQTIDRQRATETRCYGCGHDYGSRWPHGILIALITDVSGSEQADCHNAIGCIALACQRLVDEESFSEWLRDVDRVLTSAIGLGHRDLPDAPWRDYFTDGLEPSDAVQVSSDYTGVPEHLLD